MRSFISERQPIETWMALPKSNEYVACPPWESVNHETVLQIMLFALNDWFSVQSATYLWVHLYRLKIRIAIYIATFQILTFIIFYLESWHDLAVTYHTFLSKKLLIHVSKWLFYSAIKILLFHFCHFYAIFPTHCISGQVIYLIFLQPLIHENLWDANITIIRELKAKYIYILSTCDCKFRNAVSMSMMKGPSQYHCVDVTWASWHLSQDKETVS